MGDILRTEISWSTTRETALECEYLPINEIFAPGDIFHKPNSATQEGEGIPSREYINSVEFEPIVSATE